jgi:exosortase A-associated hydrolase 2
MMKITNLLTQSASPSNREERGFFTNRRGRRLFYAMHGGQNDRPAWVFCNPFLEEKVFCHPVYINFARRLSKEGWPVLRFDYEGDGDSEGDYRTIGLREWVDDVEDAISLVRSKHPSRSVNLFGLRLGASIACFAAKKSACTKLLLWDPVVDGRDYFQECLRLNLNTQLSTYGKIVEDRKQLMAKLNDGKTINISGYEVGRLMADSISSMSLATQMDNIACLVHIIAFSRPGAETVRNDMQPLTAGHEVNLRVLEVHQFWNEPRLYDAEQHALTALSLHMIADVVPDMPVTDR